MSAGLSDGNDGNKSVSSILQHELDGMNAAKGPRADVI